MVVVAVDSAQHYVGLLEQLLFPYVDWNFFLLDMLPPRKKILIPSSDVDPCNDLIPCCDPDPCSGLVP
eukprot:2256979-Ditylum_brightwellii.AAC.1